MADRFHGNEQNMEYEKFHGNEQNMEYEILLNPGTRGNDDDDDDDDDQDDFSAAKNHSQTGSTRQPDNRC